ncbi:MAG: MotA/TolQ/ExbB proton channel family protein [Polyangiaceae bacterium]
MTYARLFAETAVALATDEAAAPKPKKSLIQLVLDASLPVQVVFWGLVAMAIMVWAIALMKTLQLARMRSALYAFEREVFNFIDAKDLFASAQRYPDSPGGRVVLALSKRGGSHKVLESIGRRAIVDEQKRAGGLMTILASIASSAPFIGLFGTVYGILQAFLSLEGAKEVSLQVVGPSIGEALITTAVGLIAAIPALVFYNLLNRSVDDLVSELEAATDGWVSVVAESDSKLVPREQQRQVAAQQAPANAGYYGG